VFSVNMGMLGAYRNIDAIIEDRLARFHVRRTQEQEASDAVAQVFAARRGRIVGGMAGIVCGGLVFLSSLIIPVAPYIIDLPPRSQGALSTYLLAGSGMAAFLVAAVTRRTARGHAASGLRQEPALTGDGPEDLARIEKADPLGDLRARANALETKSIALPLAALALLAPLTIHAVLALGISVINGQLVVDGQWLRAADFTSWIALSAIFVGLAHLTLVLRMVLWARSLRRRETSSLGKGVHSAWAVTLLITAVAAFVPGVFVATDAEALSLIPPLIVLATGISFLPFAHVAAVRRLARERAALAP
jgi:hypothetical protein